MKDMTSKIDLYRSNAIRVLCSIADSQVLGNIDRYFKQVPPLNPLEAFAITLNDPLSDTAHR